MKANLLLKHNIDTLLHRRKHSRRELAQYVRQSMDNKKIDPWMSKLFAADREIPLKYLDRMAAFFGIETFQLFQPGISPLTERRHGNDRRRGEERRLGWVARAAVEIPQDDLMSEINQLTYENRQRVRHWVRATLLGQDRGQGSEGHADRGPTTATPVAVVRKPRGKRKPSERNAEAGRKQGA